VAHLARDTRADYGRIERRCHLGQCDATQGNLDAFVGPARGGHAVCIVGYRADGRFIIRNSWSTTWGDKGFGYATPAYIQGAFFNESYGATL
jgi:C1A family cysteine protease